MRATVVIDRVDDRRTGELIHSVADVSRGCVVCEITPGPRTMQRLASALMAGLGKDPDTTGRSRNAHEEWRRANAWIEGEQPRHLIVWRAHQSPRGHWEHFLKLPLTTDAHLWLVVSGTATSRGQRDAIKAHALPVLDVDAFRLVIGQLPRSSRSAAKSTRGRRFPRVPDDEFPLFLSLSEEVLDAGSVAPVTDTYWRGFDLAREWVRTATGRGDDAESGLQIFVRALLAESSGLDEVLVALRGAQAGLFRDGYLLGVDRDALAAGYCTTPRGPLDADVVQRLRRLGAPHLAALAVLTLLTVPDPRALSHLNMDCVAPDADSFAVDDRQVAVPALARGILRAHLAHRRQAGAARDDPLFVSESPGAWTNRSLQRTTPHGIQQRLRRIAVETGVLVATNDGWLRTEKRWLKRRGLLLRKLC